MRNVQADKYMEERFGKPDFSKSFLKEGMVWTPMGNYRLWRVDPIFLESPQLLLTRRKEVENERKERNKAYTGLG